MKVLDSKKSVMELATLLDKPLVVISFEIPNTPGDPFEAVMKAAPYLDPHQHFDVFADGYGVIVCEDDEEMWSIFYATLGDESPIEVPVRVHAQAISATGEILMENT
jgi:hypothetical protein